MLKKGFEKLKEEDEVVLHSDQGWQYQMEKYQEMLKEKGIRQGMSRKGNCLDNAVMEKFFWHLKSELLYLQKFKGMEDFKAEFGIIYLLLQQQ